MHFFDTAHCSIITSLAVGTIHNTSTLFLSILKKEGFKEVIEVTHDDHWCCTDVWIHPPITQHA